MSPRKFKPAEDISRKEAEDEMKAARAVDYRNISDPRRFPEGTAELRSGKP